MKINTISNKEAIDLPITWGHAPTPFGSQAIVAWSERGLCYVGFRSDDEPGMRRRWPDACFTRDDKQANELMQSLFEHPDKQTLLLKGTPLQIAVWRALLDIPHGQTTSYSDIARQAGYPRAIRAVASAVGRNDLSWIVPCHRVVRRDGSLGGYYWGLPLKTRILKWEQTNPR